MFRSLIKTMLFVAVAIVHQVGCHSRQESSQAGNSQSGSPSEGNDRSTTPDDPRVEQIRQWLEDLQGSDRTTQQIAAESLQGLGAEDAVAVPLLIAGLQASDVNVRRLSAHALGAIGASARAALQPLINVTLQAGGDWQYFAMPVVLIAQGDQGNVEVVANALRSASGDAKHRLLWIAAEFDPPAPSLTADFVDALTSSNARSREKAVVALARFGTPTIVQHVSQLTALFNDEDKEVRRIAINAVGSAAPLTTAALEPLKELIRDPDPQIQREAVLGLAMFGKEAVEALEPLAELASSNDRDIQLAALIAIGQIGHAGSAVVDRLTFGLEDPDEKIRQVTVQTLVRIAPDHDKTVQGVIAALNENSEINRGSVLSTIGDEIQNPVQPILDRLLEGLEDPRVLTRVNVMEVVLKLAQRSDAVRMQLIEQFNGGDRVQETLWTEALAAVIRRNHEYIKIGLEKRSQEVLDAFAAVRAEASKQAGSVADRITAEAERQSQP